MPATSAPAAMSAAVQPPHAVFDGVAGGQHQYRHTVAAFAQAAELAGLGSGGFRRLGGNRRGGRPHAQQRVIDFVDQPGQVSGRN